MSKNNKNFQPNNIQLSISPIPPPISPQIINNIHNSHINPPHSPDVVLLIQRKTDFFQEVIQKTILHIQKVKILDILGVSEVTKCINTLYDLCKSLKEIIDNKNEIPMDNLLTKLQNINNDLSVILKLYGTDSLDDLLTICFGVSNFIFYDVHTVRMPFFLCGFEIEFEEWIIFFHFSSVFLRRVVIYTEPMVYKMYIGATIKKGVDGFFE